MPATMQQFLSEVPRLLKPLGILHRHSRADYKEAVERLALEKLPQATELVRRKFVIFALTLYDGAKKMDQDAMEKVL